MNKRRRKQILVALLVFVIWAIFFPEDLETILVPIKHLFSVTQSVALGAYLFIATFIVCATWKSVTQSQTEE